MERRISRKRFQPACADHLPALTRQFRQYRLDLALLLSKPDPLFARDRQDIGLLAFLQEAAQGAIITVDTITVDPSQHHASLERTRQHLAGQHRFGGKDTLIWDTGSPTALAIIDPFFGQIQLAIDQGMTVERGVGQNDADLAVLNPAGGTVILARHAGGMAAFLEKASFINRAYGSTVSQIVGQIGAQTVTQCIGIPVSAAKQVLKAIRIGVAADLGQLPAILA